jgi:hypothetical protein
MSATATTNTTLKKRTAKANAQAVVQEDLANRMLSDDTVKALIALAIDETLDPATYFQKRMVG